MVRRVTSKGVEIDSLVQLSNTIRGQRNRNLLAQKTSKAAKKALSRTLVMHSKKSRKYYPK